MLHLLSGKICSYIHVCTIYMYIQCISLYFSLRRLHQENIKTKHIFVKNKIIQKALQYFIFAKPILAHCIPLIFVFATGITLKYKIIARFYILFFIAFLFHSSYLNNYFYKFCTINIQKTGRICISLSAFKIRHCVHIAIRDSQFVQTSYVSAMASDVTRHTRTMRDRAAAITQRDPLRYY